MRSAPPGPGSFRSVERPHTCDVWSVVIMCHPQAIHPDWDVMKDLYDAKGGRSGVTENRIMRLAFHDCVKYTGKEYENKTTRIL